VCKALDDKNIIYSILLRPYLKSFIFVFIVKTPKKNIISTKNILSYIHFSFPTRIKIYIYIFVNSFIKHIHIYIRHIIHF